MDRWLRHLDLLRRWGRTYNLVAPGEFDHLVTRHLLDSLAIHAAVGDGPLLDVGTGAGFPGLPLAILEPERPTVLIDSAGKKVRFLGHVIRELGLAQVEAIHGRVESFSPRLQFSTIVSRAFSSLGDFARLTRHLAGPDTRLVAMKGQLRQQELEALPAWVRLVGVEALDVPGLEAERHQVTLTLEPLPKTENRT
ncbi:MAG: 16S rRNA (guanine(527)-N(7))-methyltransferase RsmG [Xanthomonadales bacterium]|nr:16S rRNA (guanine(527)-N(7))-methyltransferase RsmG [Xanthomonadales bacterium]